MHTTPHNHHINTNIIYTVSPPIPIISRMLDPKAFPKEKSTYRKFVTHQVEVEKNKLTNIFFWLVMWLETYNFNISTFHYAMNSSYKGEASMMIW